METVEIPREDWSRRLNEFTAIHEGWLISLDILGAELGATDCVSRRHESDSAFSGDCFA